MVLEIHGSKSLPGRKSFAPFVQSWLEATRMLWTHTLMPVLLMRMGDKRNCHKGNCSITARLRRHHGMMKLRVSVIMLVT